MFEHIADFTTWPILTGILIGYIANRIMSGEGKGCCMNLFIGIVGSYAGAFISTLLIDQIDRDFVCRKCKGEFVERKCDREPIYWTLPVRK